MVPLSGLRSLMMSFACWRAVGSTGSLISSFTWSGVIGVRYFSLLPTDILNTIDDDVCVVDVRLSEVALFETFCRGSRRLMANDETLDVRVVRRRIRSSVEVKSKIVTCISCREQ